MTEQPSTPWTKDVPPTQAALAFATVGALIGFATFWPTAHFHRTGLSWLLPTAVFSITFAGLGAIFGDGERLKRLPPTPILIKRIVWIVIFEVLVVGIMAWQWGSMGVALTFVLIGGFCTLFFLLVGLRILAQATVRLLHSNR